MCVRCSKEGANENEMQDKKKMLSECTGDKLAALKGPKERAISSALEVPVLSFVERGAAVTVGATAGSSELGPGSHRGLVEKQSAPVNQSQPLKAPTQAARPASPNP